MFVRVLQLFNISDATNRWNWLQCLQVCVFLYMLHIESKNAHLAHKVRFFFYLILPVRFGSCLRLGFKEVRFFGGVQVSINIWHIAVMDSVRGWRLYYVH